MGKPTPVKKVPIPKKRSLGNNHWTETEKADFRNLLDLLGWPLILPPRLFVKYNSIGNITPERLVRKKILDSEGSAEEAETVPRRKRPPKKTDVILDELALLGGNHADLFSEDAECFQQKKKQASRLQALLGKKQRTSSGEPEKPKQCCWLSETSSQYRIWFPNYGVDLHPRITQSALLLTSEPDSIDLPLVQGGNVSGAERPIRWQLRGWVGPNRTGSRFALVTSIEHQTVSTYRLCVVDIDTSGSGAEIASNALVACDSVISTRRWAVVVPCIEKSLMTLWNFDHVEVGRVEEASRIELPWAAERMAIDGDHLVVAPKVAKKTEQPLGVVVVDLPATMETKRLAISQHIVTSTHGSFWRLWSWNQRVYATLTDDSLMCVSSGERTIYPQSFRLMPIGGPYFYVDYQGSYAWYVYSATEPDKLCCRHTAEGMHTVIFGQELAVKVPGLGPNRVAVVDAVSGLVIFKIPNSEDLLSVAEVLAH
ncbi:hypothetical protein Pelo_18212 [Pelomyxa schiedti]|nr:hypothetical protein Pelo_18212 [Pelomyxa schiedti]